MIEEWVEQCQRGQTRQFAQIVRHLQDPIFGFIYRMVHNREWAEDLAQEVFLRAFRHLAHYDRSKASFTTWLYTIARNLCVDELRRKRPVQVEYDEAIEWNTVASDTPHHALLDGELAEKIAQEVRALDPPFREVFILFEYEQLPMERIADVVGCPLGTVKSRLRRARLQLQRKLVPYMCR